MKTGEDYKCILCPMKYDNKRHLKNHLFIYHNDIQVKATYNRSISRILGDVELTRMRKPLLKKMIEGSFDSFIYTLIEPSSTTDDPKIDYRLPIL